MQTDKRQSLQTRSKYLTSIISLRGIAALIVALFHFTKGYVDDGHWLSYLVIHYGWIGVEIFFVVSGFVIPYGLLHKEFAVNNFKEFILKRIVRIHPAYLASIGLVLVLNYFSTFFSIYNGPPFSVSMTNLFYNIFYLVEFTNGNWLNPVYWTLAIEFQYYIVIGVLLILWNSRNNYVIFFSTLVLLLSSIPDFGYIKFFEYADIFVIGIIVAFYKRELIGKNFLICAQIAIAIVIFFNHGIAIAGLVLATSVTIAFYSYSLGHSVFLFLGNISYSLYLVHIPVGGRLINLARRMELSMFLQIVMIIMALAISIFLSWLMYLYIEKPSHQWSRSMKLTKN